MVVDIDYACRVTCTFIVVQAIWAFWIMLQMETSLGKTISNNPFESILIQRRLHGATSKALGNHKEGFKKK